MGCEVMVVSFFSLLVPAAANAACGVDPPLPPEGFSWPASGPVSNEWSLDCHTDRGHRGIDIDVTEGDPILASAGGYVVFTGYTPAEGGGMTISIEHEGGMRTTYLHLAQVKVTEGQPVSKGQQLGSSDGSPLHFGMKVTTPREVYFNPASWLAPPESTSTTTGPPPETAPGTESDPASSSTSAPEQSASQPSPGSATTVPSDIASDSVTAITGTIQATPAGAATNSTYDAAPIQWDFASGSAATTLLASQERPYSDITANNAATTEADRLYTRFDGSGSSPDKSLSTYQATNPDSTIPGDHSPIRDLLLAGLLITATAGSGLWLKEIHQEPVPVC